MIEGMHESQTVDSIAAELGASEVARKKWRQRGVPYRWRYEILQIARVRGLCIPEEAFEPCARNRAGSA